MADCARTSAFPYSLLFFNYIPLFDALIVDLAAAYHRIHGAYNKEGSATKPNATTCIVQQFWSGGDFFNLFLSRAIPLIHLLMNWIFPLEAVRVYEPWAIVIAALSGLSLGICTLITFNFDPRGLSGCDYHNFRMWSSQVIRTEGGRISEAFAGLARSRGRICFVSRK